MRVSGGQHEVGQVGQALVNLLVQAVALAAEDAVPVLHAQRGAGETVVLGDGQIDDFVGFKEGREDRPAFEHHAAEFDFAESSGSGRMTSAPSARAAAWMPERWKQRRGSLQLTSVTMTRLAPACQHWRTTSATTSGLVLAACSGVRSQAMLGLRTTTSWRLTKRSMPPRFCERLLDEGARFAALHHGHDAGMRRSRDDATRWSRRACSAVAGTGRRLCSLSQTAGRAAPAATPPTRSSCSMASRRVMARGGCSCFALRSGRLRRPWFSDLPGQISTQVNALGIVGAQLVRGVGGGGDVARRAAGGFERGHAHFGALALDHLPGSVIEGHAVFADDESVGMPEPLGTEAGTAIVDRRHGVADGEADLLADDGDAVQVGHAGIAVVRVQSSNGCSTTPYMFFMAKVTPAML